MDCILLENRSIALEKQVSGLGFTRSYFLDDMVVLTATDKKSLLLESKKAKKSGKIVMFKPQTEDMLRFALDKTVVDAVFGIEGIHLKDHTHYVRGGLDQVLAKIAFDKKKVICFSFSSMLNARNLGFVIARMKLNLKLCKKYKVPMFFGIFSCVSELRSASDLFALWQLIGGKSKETLKLPIVSSR
ncbi:hypothetical protein HOI26_05040 [Candidatus Woesearchaeota archaeon]|nr:hypothetical protein [Candidatus Woesearchaeota archaeon]